jgi:hypothetical protein
MQRTQRPIERAQYGRLLGHDRSELHSGAQAPPGVQIGPERTESQSWFDWQGWQMSRGCVHTGASVGHGAPPAHETGQRDAGSQGPSAASASGASPASDASSVTSASALASLAANGVRS